jgi:mono/diheme cytochrome c family protein
MSKRKTPCNVEQGTVMKMLQIAVVDAILVLAVTALPVSAQSMAVAKPSAGLMPNPATGKELYTRYCAQCHGADLEGSDRGPPFLHKIYESSHHGDISFQIAAQRGVRAHHWRFGDMPPVPGVTPDDIAHIIAYVRYEQRKVGID